jgi:hypothetical protein
VRNKVLLLAVFGLAMAYVEAAVVVYLREIIYPEGFAFPLKTMDMRLAAVEVAREAATIFMLLSVAYLAEKTRRGRFACFVFLFGLWDIGYYLWLWVTIGWPESLLTWDILFLIPVIWSGPVLAPILVSCVFVAAGLLYYSRRDAAEEARISRLTWMLAALSALVIFVAFVFNHVAVSAGGVPGRFPWEIFAAGLALAAYLLIKVRGQVLKCTRPGVRS